MVLLVEVVVMSIVLSVHGHKHHHHGDQAINQKHVARSNVAPQSIYGKHIRVVAKDDIAPLKTYKDVFIPGQGGKPTLGTTSATCWARGGICVEIRECPHLKIDVDVAGCSYGHKICCKVHDQLSPTVGRRARIPTINRPEDLGSVLQVIAYRNSLLLSNMENGDYQDDKEIDGDIAADST